MTTELKKLELRSSEFDDLDENDLDKDLGFGSDDDLLLPEDGDDLFEIENDEGNSEF